MSATQEEVEDGEAEGTHLLTTVAQQRSLSLKTAKSPASNTARTKPGEPDARGRRRPVPIPGSEFTIKCNTVIPAIGQIVDRASLMPNRA